MILLTWSSEFSVGRNLVFKKKKILFWKNNNIAINSDKKLDNILIRSLIT